MQQQHPSIRKDKTMSTLAASKPYGTYQRVQYQTVDLQPLKQLGLGMLKLIAVLFIAIATLVVAITLFQMLVVASQFVGAWLLVHGWQVGITAVVFYGSWKVKP